MISIFVKVSYFKFFNISSFKNNRIKKWITIVIDSFEGKINDWSSSLLWDIQRIRLFNDINLCAFPENYHGSNTGFLVGVLVSVVSGVFLTFALVALCYRSSVVHKNITLCLRLVRIYLLESYFIFSYRSTDLILVGSVLSLLLLDFLEKLFKSLEIYARNFYTSYQNPFVFFFTFSFLSNTKIFSFSFINPP